VIQVLDSERLLVENVNMVKRHTKPDPGRNKPGGIVEKEAAINISNVAMFNPVTGKADRIGFKSLEDGNKVRIFKSTGEAVDI
jgi:large subunit ribosomal protein L24